jgi:hypothetical protein
MSLRKQLGPTHKPEKQQNQVTEGSRDANLDTAHFLGAKRSSWVACCWIVEKPAQRAFQKT